MSYIRCKFLFQLLDKERGGYISKKFLNFTLAGIVVAASYIFIKQAEKLFKIEFTEEFYLVTFILELIIVMIILFIQDKKRKTSNKENSKGWKDVAYPEPPHELLTDKPKDWCIGAWKGKYVCLPVTRDGVNMIVIGSPGSGKSVFLLNVLYALIYSDVISSTSVTHWNAYICDIKGELYKKLTPESKLPYKATGADKIHVVQPSNRDSYGWDVFYRIRGNVSETDKLKAVSDIADALIDKSNGDDAFFTVNAKRILTGVFYFCINKNWEFIPIIKEITNRPLAELLKSIVEQAVIDKDTIVLSKLQSFVGKEDNESVGDIETTLKQYLDVFLYPDIVYALDTNSMKTSPEVLNDGITFLDLAIEESMLSTYQPVFRLITMQVLRHCESEFKEEDNRITSLIIDEAARVGRIDDIENSMATLRSKHTNLVLLFQQLQQFQHIYKKELAETIINLCEIKMWLSSSGDKETVDYISNIVGDYITERKNYKHGSVITDKSDVKYSEDRQDVITGKSISNLRENKELICIYYGHYMRVKKLFYFNDPYLKKIPETLKQESTSRREK